MDTPEPQPPSPEKPVNIPKTLEQKKKDLVAAKSKIQKKISEISFRENAKKRKDRVRRLIELGAQVEGLVGAEGPDAVEKVKRLAKFTQSDIGQEKLNELIRIARITQHALQYETEDDIEKAFNVLLKTSNGTLPIVTYLHNKVEELSR